ncbi:MAG: hypothetical protein HOV66_07615 [Streptomycetaceae bacterium]|nr:hypothetical protein [Streptomycetaceae bacterium]
MSGRRPAAAPRPPMCDRQHAAITAELVRLTLGGRPARPELQTTIPEPAPRRRPRRTR